MKLTQEGIDLIKSFEACRLKAYPDPATKGEPYTIGYGHTGREVVPNLVWTQGEADLTLQDDLHEVGYHLQRLIKITLTDNEFSAIICLVFNIGIGNFAKSTLLKLVNQGLSTDSEIEAVCNEFLKWNKAGGNVMAGLTRRRMAEAALFVK